MALSGIGAGTLKALSNMVKPLLADSCTVKRPSKTNDGAGGYSTSLATVGTYACYVDVVGRRGGGEDVSAERIIVEERYQISFMAGTVAILPQDQITQASSGVTYLVTNNIDNVTNSPVLTVNAQYVSK